MIATVTLNPAVDIRLKLQDFQVNGVFRCADSLRTAGGKGLNVAKVLQILGNSVRTTGFLGGLNGRFIAQELEKLNVHNQFVPIKGETRNCYAILADSASQTEILESGPVIQEEERAAFEKVFDLLLSQANWIVASGSLPRGIDSSFYRWMGKRAQAKGKKFILDTSGEALVQGIKGRPFLIKPNREELESISHRKMIDSQQIIDCARQLCDLGAENVIVSLGANGAILVNKAVLLQAHIPKIDVVNPVGSGDSMIAGCLHRLAKGDSMMDSFRYGCAAGMANALEEETGMVKPDTIKELLQQIKLDERGMA